MTTVFACIIGFSGAPGRVVPPINALPGAFLHRICRRSALAIKGRHLVPRLVHQLWIALPHAPVLVFGGSAERLQFGSAWTTFTTGHCWCYH